MTTAREVLKQFYGAAIARDLAKARTYLHDDWFSLAYLRHIAAPRTTSQPSPGFFRSW
jgi:hypothetical protein